MQICHICYKQCLRKIISTMGKIFFCWTHFECSLHKIKKEVVNFTKKCMFKESNWALSKFFGRKNDKNSYTGLHFNEAQYISCLCICRICCIAKEMFCSVWPQLRNFLLTFGKTLCPHFLDAIASPIFKLCEQVTEWYFSLFTFCSGCCICQALQPYFSCHGIFSR